MEYIREGSPLPVPFNIIPTPHSALQLITATYRRWRDWHFERRANQAAQACASSSCGDEENSPIYTTRTNGSASANSANIPMWQVKSVYNSVALLYCTYFALPGFYHLEHL